MRLLIDEKLRAEVGEIVLEIRQYLCNTEFAPQPFTEPLDPKKLTQEFPEKIIKLVAELTRKETEEKYKEHWKRHLEICAEASKETVAEAQREIVERLEGWCEHTTNPLQRRYLCQRCRRELKRGS